MGKHIIITIGRQFGSSGKLVATAIGKKLSVPVYDNELILKSAEASGFSEQFFKRSDEKKRFFSLGYSQNAINDEGLFKIQSSVIRKLADSGDAVFVGRASDYVLRDYKCLDVFVSAPVEVRRETVSKRLNISLEEADKLITKKDRARENWYNFFTFGNWGVASNYDLCIDSSILGVDGTADFIIDYARCMGIVEK